LVRWIPDDSAREAALLKDSGFADFEELFADIPAKVRTRRLGVGPAHTEQEVVAEIDALLGKNRPYSDFHAFLGGRTPIRYVPAAVDGVLSRSEFYTSYTPYQPEASQGLLQALFEFQSLVVELTGMDVANASLYDGATAAGEALLLCHRIHAGNRFLIPASLPWEEKSVLRNYGSGASLRIDEIPFDSATGRLDLGALRSAVAAGDVFGALVDLPNGFGVVDEGVTELRSVLGDVPLVAVADPLALTVLEPPGSWGADVVVGEGQGFGAAPSFGGPLLGFMAFRREHVRFSPGRIVGATTDGSGRRAFTLTLQTREQHIRRSRATSNICTNQSLLALAFLAYASVVGPEGLRALERQLTTRAHQLAEALGKIPGIRAPRFASPFLSDFTLEVERGTAADFLEHLVSRKVLGGAPLSDPRSPSSTPMTRWVLVGATESTDESAIRRYVQAATSTLSQGEGTP
jgi:glycine cleavage system P protein (glycine dehydrogenase) subunit 1